MGTVGYALIATPPREVPRRGARRAPDVPDDARAGPAGRGSPDTPSPKRTRIVDAALRRIASSGLAGMTLDDIAREAGVSRATVYRTFPGGRAAVLAAAAETEIARFMSAVAVEMGAARDLESTLVAGIGTAARRIDGHRVLHRLLDDDPGLVVVHIAFGRLDRVVARVGAVTAPFLARWMDAHDAVRIAQWAARIVISYAATPAPGLDLTDDGDVTHLVRTFVLPGVRALGARTSCSTHRKGGHPHDHR